MVDQLIDLVLDSTNPYITAYFSYINLVLNQRLDRDLPFWFTRGFTGVLSNTIVNHDHVLLQRLVDGNRPLRDPLGEVFALDELHDNRARAT